jgi:hypothetical protein
LFALIKAALECRVNLDKVVLIANYACENEEAVGLEARAKIGLARRGIGEQADQLFKAAGNARICHSEWTERRIIGQWR